VARQIRILEEPGILRGPAARYGAVPPTFACLVSIIGIPVVPIAYLLARWHQKHYYKRLQVVLTRRDLIVRRGVWNRQEKSIPLEKITDVALLEGPIMRMYGVKGLRVETAGQVSGPAGLVNLVGIENPEAFRDAILEQRDRVSDGEEDATALSTPGGSGAHGLPDGATHASPAQAAAAVAGFGGANAAADPEVLALLRDIRDQLRTLAERDER
jgi:putative membrane protein